MTPPRWAGAACGALLAAAIVAATVAARHADPAEVSPVVPAGAWNAVWIAALVAALVLYGIGWLTASRLRTRVALTVAIAVQAVPLAAPLLLSKDAYLYWDEARIITVHDASPYTTTPSAYPNDPALPWVSEGWRSLEAPYGPVWEAVATVPALAAGDSAHDAQLGYRALAFAGVAAALLLLARRRDAGAVALVGWNPLVALHFAGGGHSDAWLVALLVLAVVARGTAKAGAAWPLAAGFKVFPLVVLPLELMRTRLREPRRFWIGFAGAAGAIVVGASAAFGTGWVKNSLTGVRTSSPLGGVHWLTQAGLSHRHAVIVGALVFLAIYAVLMVSAWRTGRARLWAAATALCLCSSILRPWYVLWPAGLAAAEDDGLGGVAVVALTAYLLLGDAVRL
jgi:hypothetical protein